MLFFYDFKNETIYVKDDYRILKYLPLRISTSISHHSSVITTSVLKKLYINERRFLIIY